MRRFRPEGEPLDGERQLLPRTYELAVSSVLSMWLRTPTRNPTYYALLTDSFL